MSSSNLSYILDQLRSGRLPLMVWGLGYIGLTTVEAYLRSGYSVVGLDTSLHRCEEISGGPILLNSETQLAVDLSREIARGQLKLIHRIDQLEGQVGCHFICVPTERRGEAYQEALTQTLLLILERTPDVPIIIESTLSPRWIGETPLLDQDFIVAPRRDWFHSPEHTLKSLTRVVGATNLTLLRFATDLLSSVSEAIVPSSDVLAVATSKAFENSIWYLLFSYVGELAVSQSEVDFGEVLRLTRTNWRTPFEFKPAFQVGGYCLPLSYDYLSELVGDRPLGLLQAAASANAHVIDALVEDLIARNVRSVLILGLTYRPGIKVTTNSAGTKLAQACKQHGLKVRAHDPLLSPREISDLTEGCSCEVPREIDCCEAILVCTDHKLYTEMDVSSQLEASRNIREILDCCGALNKYIPQFEQKSINYRQLATRSW
jgi:nucleotide sugar dehydrogenase